MRHRDANHIKYKITLPLIILLSMAALYFFHSLVVEKQRISNLKQAIEDVRSDAFRLISADSSIQKKYELERYISTLNILESMEEGSALFKIIHHEKDGFYSVSQNFITEYNSKVPTDSTLKQLDEIATLTLIKLNRYQHKSAINKIKIEYGLLFLICILAALHFFLVDKPMKEEMLRNAREKEVCNSTIRKLAERDTLTNLPGRMKFYEESEREISSATRYGSDLALIKMDIHDFKTINQKYGQKAGDKILAGFARTVRKHLRRPDSFFRVGGDKFIILAPHTTSKNAKNLAEKIDKLVLESKVLKIVPFKINTGIATVGPDETAETLLKKVNIALKKSKNMGAGTIYTLPESTKPVE